MVTWVASNVIMSYSTSGHLWYILFAGFMPLTENMPSGKATKPGDVVTAMNGKTIQVSGPALKSAM